MIGNDVVDLGQADTRENAQHAGFDRRVFDARERAAIAADAEPRRRRWMLWAAKEAAYKALRRDHPGFVFSPRALRVELGPDGRGTVHTAAGAVAVRVAADGDAVSALATAPGTPPRAVSEHTLPISPGQAGSPPRDAIRAALAERLCSEAARRGHGEGATLERRDRVPSLRVGPYRFPVSISHHGRLARAAVLWRTGDPSRPRGVQ